MVRGFANARKCGIEVRQNSKTLASVSAKHVSANATRSAARPPISENLIVQSNQYIQALQNFDLRCPAALNGRVCRALEQLWNIFRNLSYRSQGPRNVRNGFAGIVGISKAVLLLTEGLVGPAFDKNVKSNLKISEPENAQQWFDSLQKVAKDISSFEAKNQCTLQKATPPAFAGLHSGRIYDMALGPR